MKKTLTGSIVLGILMLSAAALSQVMTPTVRLAKLRPALDLEQVIPHSFGDWREETLGAAMVINPETARTLATIYSQTLSRTFVNGAGERIMLSIAYGADQTSGLQLHYPEVCYPAQGFNLYSVAKGTLATGYGTIPIKRLNTALGARHEPVTYWTTIADKVVLGGYDTKFALLSYGFRGEIPDGLIFRVSTIATDLPGAYALEDQFVRTLFAAVPGSVRSRFLGGPG